MAEAIFRGAYRPKGVSPEVVVDELVRIYQDVEQPTPVDIVEAARPKNAPLHPAFEWNDKKAGEAYRLVQAGQMLRSVYIKTTPSDPSPVRFFLTVQGDDPRKMHSYLPTTDASSEQIAEVTQRWADDIAALERRLQALGLFVGRVPEIMTELREAVAAGAAA
jgi:beta-galactosidase/beta-glucuronidase